MLSALEVFQNQGNFAAIADVHAIKRRAYNLPVIHGG